MLVLVRKTGEEIDVTLEDGRVITITLLKAEAGKARFGIDAPETIIVDRREVTLRKQAETSAKEANGNE